MEVTLECKKRPTGRKPGALRRDGLIPASLYGHKGAEADSLVINAKDAQTLLKQASTNNTLVNLKVPDLPWSGKALLREVQAHPWKRTLYHLSFFSVGAQDSVEVVVPLHLVGEAAGTKEGGILEQTITELTVQCAPDRIPESIDIDVSDMEVGASVHISEIVVPEGVTVMDEPQTTAFSIVPPSMGAGADATAEETEAEVLTEVGTEPAEPAQASEEPEPEA